MQAACAASVRSSRIVDLLHTRMRPSGRPPHTLPACTATLNTSWPAAILSYPS